MALADYSDDKIGEIKPLQAQNDVPKMKHGSTVRNISRQQRNRKKITLTPPTKLTNEVLGIVSASAKPISRREVKNIYFAINEMLADAVYLTATHIGFALTILSRDQKISATGDGTRGTPYKYYLSNQIESPEKHIDDWFSNTLQVSKM